MKQDLIILFDGECNFCNSAVNFVIKRDRQRRFRFATLQSEPARDLLAKYDIVPEQITSFVFLEHRRLFTSSQAALRVCKYLDGAWKCLFGFIIVPRFIRDGVYNWISRNRYRWFGKREQCMIPSEEVRSQFLK